MADPSLVLDLVFLKEVVRLSLCGRVGVRIVEKVLNAKRNLLDGDGGLPTFLLIQDRQTDGARRVYIGMEQRGRELACKPAALSA
jgi:hypothetical protein